MKYVFLTILSFYVGFLLPALAAGWQLLLAWVLIGISALVVLYYIETRINAVRL